MDLNKACLNDEFLFPIIELMVDNTSSNIIFPLMDGLFSDNQIKIALEDKSFTAFKAPIRVYYNKVMVFRPMNTNATY